MIVPFIAQGVAETTTTKQSEIQQESSGSKLSVEAVHHYLAISGHFAVDEQADLTNVTFFVNSCFLQSFLAWPSLSEHL